MDGRVKQEPDQALGTATAPIPVDDIPLELFRIYPTPCDDDNVVNKAIYHQLIKQYIAEKNDWPPELQDDFRSEDKRLDYRISRTTGIASMHKISRRMLSEERTWARFWTLRVMFGPTACANQGWFEEFARDYPIALNDAPAGIIPENFEDLFGLQQWTPEEPQMERWIFHPTTKTRYGKRKAVKALNVDGKRPKSVPFSAFSFNIDAMTKISTTAVSEVRIARPAREEGRNTTLQDSHGNRSGSLTRTRQPNQQFNDNISRLEMIVRQCSALQKAQAEALNLLCSQIQLLKEERRANEKCLEE
ncbi:hypothetical protein CFAM422_009939 [Trichoderma lentiforme]|uniref:Uncharacterized protein n=1 Tax=Trichoderma lentiforme TaxID=1567552 RepID=A0A9P4X9L9_9HYPO|nr:hypothetical protein CFAM422_009939 [Trichoderma lentiforme]